MGHRDAFKRLGDNAPHRRNGSPQFSDDDVNAHTVHTGRKGGNKIDQKAGAAIGKELLAALAGGELQIVSVSPPEFADPAKLKGVNDAVENGTAVVDEITTSQTSKADHSRTKGLGFKWLSGPFPPLSIVYKTA